MQNQLKQRPSAGERYHRNGTSGLPPEAIRDLNAWFELNRSYYDIPLGQPVYPSRPVERSVKRPEPAERSRKNANHPWRGRS